MKTPSQKKGYTCNNCDNMGVSWKPDSSLGVLGFGRAGKTVVFLTRCTVYVCTTWVTAFYFNIQHFDVDFSSPYTGWEGS